MKKSFEKLPKNCCLRCHFFKGHEPSDEQPRPLTMADREKIIQAGPDADLQKIFPDRTISLTCHKGCWDWNNRNDDEETSLLEKTKKDRGTICFFLSYSPGMQLSTAEQLEPVVRKQKASFKARQFAGGAEWANHAVLKSIATALWIIAMLCLIFMIFIFITIL